MVINAINNFLCHFFFVIADKSLERKAIREKMLLKILSSRPRVESKGTSSFPRKLFQRKATSRKNTMRNFLCRKFTLGSMSIRKPKESNSLLKIFFSSNKIHPRAESRATSPRSKRDSPPPSEGKQFFVKKCYQKFFSSISQIHSRIQLLFQPFRSPPKESNSPSKIFFDKIHRKQLLLFLFLLFRTLSKRGSPPNSEGKQFGFAKKCAVIHASRAPRVEGGRMSLACRTSFPVSPGKSIQRPRHGVQHPHRAPKRSTVITILHVTLSAHPTGRGGKGGGGGGRKRWMEGRRMRRTLTTLQYTGGHGVYKPPQFYLRPF